MLKDYIWRIEMVEKKLCSNCERELDNDWMYCPYCGTKVN
jgi:RNA polymerase subunit RPABC4/transcription elongation factor Spt4